MNDNIVKHICNNIKKCLHRRICSCCVNIYYDSNVQLVLINIYNVLALRLESVSYQIQRGS